MNLMEILLMLLPERGFQIAHDISSYSFTALAKGAKPLLNENSALLTLTYLGAIQSLPNYNVMGLAKASLEANVRFMASSLGKDEIRVNGISAGPIKTLAVIGSKELQKNAIKLCKKSSIGKNSYDRRSGKRCCLLML